MSDAAGAGRKYAEALLGGIIGAVLGTGFVVLVTSLIKAVLDWVIRQENWVTLIAPFVGIGLSAVLLYTFAQGRARLSLAEEAAAPRGFRAWLRAPSNALRADLTGDVVRAAGREEQFPWRLAPLRAMAIISTVGSGAPMGTESPAAHLGVAAGASLGGARGWVRRLVRPAAISGGAAGVAALMGLPLVGLVFMLELGRRNQAALSTVRIIPAACGALIGWAVNAGFGLEFIRLVVPSIGPQGIWQALGVAAIVGVVSGALSSVMGTAIYHARRWSSRPLLKVLLGGLALLGCILLIRALAGQQAAIGPGAGAVSWAETAEASIWVLLAVAVLRAIATTSAVAAGGTGGLFVPLLAIGDLIGRAFAPLLGTTSALAASAGAAGAIAGGYRLPFTAIVMVLTLGGPETARLTCVATVAVAAMAGIVAGYALDRLGMGRA